MDWMDGRVVVMAPESVAEGIVIDPCHIAQHKNGTEIVTGHDGFLFLARGEGTYRINGHEGLLRPNTLIAAPAGTIACTLSDDRELYVVSVRDPEVTLDDQRGFIPFFEKQLSAEDGRRWYERMSEAADRAQRGLFGDDDIRQLKNTALPYIWQRESRPGQEMLRALFAFIWDHIATPLSLEQLAADAGYTANYLNDLTRAHTGRALGRWIGDMRMARARIALEKTELSVAEIGVACGYDDPAYFSRVFRRAHGVPPAMWRIAKRPVDARYNRVAFPMALMREYELRGAAPERSYSFAS